MRFENLDVWQKARKLSVEIYATTSLLKDYGFRDQITRAGLSVPSNIAEGFERDSEKECIKFLSYAKGSAGELRTQLYIGIDIGYFEQELGKKLLLQAEEISLMLSGLMKRKRSFLKCPAD